MTKPNPKNMDSAPDDGYDDYTEADYFAEMGFSLEDRIEAQRRRDALYEEAQKPLPCGHLTHEDGGPADYGPRCRR